jgi:tryptophan synthase alpha chain
VDDTRSIATHLEQAGADLIEIGIPFSDPVADGPTIQRSNQIALENGMTLKRLFEQLKTLRSQVSIPVILMGYINPILQYGMTEFCEKCVEVGVDGVIFPDLPMDVFQREYQALFEKHNLHNTFLITPQTSEQRILKIDQMTSGFIYMVSSASVTGAKVDVSADQEAYFERIKQMNLQNPQLIGFGISNQSTFEKACMNANGAIVGSAFIKMLSEAEDLEIGIKEFVKEMRTK